MDDTFITEKRAVKVKFKNTEKRSVTFLQQMCLQNLLDVKHPVHMGPLSVNQTIFVVSWNYIKSLRYFFPTQSPLYN